MAPAWAAVSCWAACRWYEVGRRLCSISAYELQLIDDKIRDAGIIDFAGV